MFFICSQLTVSSEQGVATVELVAQSEPEDLSKVIDAARDAIGKALLPKRKATIGAMCFERLGVCCTFFSKNPGCLRLETWIMKM